MNSPTAQSPTLQPNGAQVIAINAESEIDKHACGRIVMWSLGGDVTVEALTNALDAAGSKAISPDEPSALVALHRAVDATAKVLGHLDVHHKGRGAWAIVSKGVETVDANGNKVLQYPIACEATVTRDNGTETLVVEGQGAEQIRAAYHVAKHTLAPADIGTWLCDKLAMLKALALRDRGGVYFVPQPSVWKWQRLVTALTACSKHKVHTIPAMKSSDAAEAILASLTAATQEACDKIVAEVNDGMTGAKALANRKDATADLLSRVTVYEGLLGDKLDALRNVIAETQAAVATAAFAAGGETAD